MLRAALQILIIYSFVTGDCSWVYTKSLKGLESAHKSLSKMIFHEEEANTYPVTDTTSLRNCLLLANLLEFRTKPTTLRVEITRKLSALADNSRLANAFQHYNPNDGHQTANATTLLTNLYPDNHYLTGMAFALVVNPIPSFSQYDSPPKYDGKDEEMQRLIDYSASHIGKVDRNPQIMT